jgi:hypothetical protein
MTHALVAVGRSIKSVMVRRDVYREIFEGVNDR